MPNPLLLVIPCATKINCPGTDSPFANLTMEAPDSELFIGVDFGPSLRPPLNWTWQNPRGFSFCGSFDSQADANLCARRQAFDDQVDQPPGDPDGGNWRDLDGNPPTIFQSSVQQCNASCGDGTIFTYRIPAGTVHDIVQADADAAALSEACQIAELIKICIGALTSSACIDQTYSSAADIRGQGPFTFSIISGSLPPGLTLSSGGTQTNQNALLLFGTPTIAGTYTFTVQVVGAAGDQQKTFTIMVWGLNNPSVIDDFTEGSPYSYQFTGIGGTPPYTFAPATQADLNAITAAGLTLGTDGLLSGTPVGTDPILFTVRITDSTP